MSGGLFVCPRCGVTRAREGWTSCDDPFGPGAVCRRGVVVFAAFDPVSMEYGEWSTDPAAANDAAVTSTGFVIGGFAPSWPSPVEPIRCARECRYRPGHPGPHEDGKGGRGPSAV